MSKQSRNIKKDFEERISTVMKKSSYLGLFALSFTMVLREGIEAVLFTESLLINDLIGTIYGIAIGIAIVLIASIAILRGVTYINIRKFFTYTSIVLIAVSAGILGYGVHELIEVLAYWALT